MPAGAADLQHPVLGDDQTRFGQVEDLRPGETDRLGVIGQDGIATVTTGRTVLDDGVRIGHPLKIRPLTPPPDHPVAAGGPAPRARRRLAERAVRARRLRGVRGILREAPLQLRVLHAKPGILGPDLSQLRTRGLQLGLDLDQQAHNLVSNHAGGASTRFLAPPGTS